MDELFDIEDYDKWFNCNDENNYQQHNARIAKSKHKANNENDVNANSSDNSSCGNSYYNLSAMNDESVSSLNENDNNNNSSNIIDDESDNKSNDSDNDDNNDVHASSLIHKHLQPHAIEDNIDTTAFDQLSLAMTFPFHLDDFQKRALIRLEQHKNVLVCAHTSSGKTVVAEYGIAQGKHHHKRVLYTSPIKALSNQKYREFKSKFGDVGILTGDVSINPDAQCLIMTTEILQNSLYKNSELLNSVEWVVFDEVHYINDNERGHVWEEILILLPKQIGLIMLSATVPNYLEFAQWVGKIKNTTIYIENTLKRVVPLEHKIFLDHDNVIMVKDKNSHVYDNNLDKAFKIFKNKQKKQTIMSEREKNAIKSKKNEFYNNITYFEQFQQRGKNKKRSTNTNNTLKITNIHLLMDDLVNYLYDNELNPAVIFVFSIKRINEHAKSLSLLNLVTKDESSQIRNFFRRCIQTLPAEDRSIPQILEMEVLIQNGIGVHHSGLLPILKEIVEILYSNGLIKVLFATTSFSIGLNMPTRTVVFTEFYKFNDEKREILSSSEYLQMCGRAGRRGIDSIGNVFLLFSDKVQENDKGEILNMLKQTGTQVESKFRLSYKTIVSFLSRNIKNINSFLKESFLENLNIKEIPTIKKDIEDRKVKLKEFQNAKCVNSSNNNSELIMKEFYVMYKRLVELNEIVFLNKLMKEYLHNAIGLVMKVYDNEEKKEMFVVFIKLYTEFDNDFWCLKAKRTNMNEDNDKMDESSKTKGKKIKNKKRAAAQIKPTDKTGVIDDITFTYCSYYSNNILTIYNKTFTFNNRNLTDKDLKEDNDQYLFVDIKILKHFVTELLTLNTSSSSQIEPLNYSAHFNKDIDLITKANERENILSLMYKHPCVKCEQFQTHFNDVKHLFQLQYEITKLEKDLNPENMLHYEEFETRLKILQKFGYLDENRVITLKGKAAREINTSDCVLISELLVSDILIKLSDEEIVAFVSGFASNRNEIEIDKEPNISREFGEAVKQFQKLYEHVKDVESECNNFEESKYNRRMTFSLSKALKMWMQNHSFASIVKETDLDEGKMYNLIMRIFLFMEEIINFYGTLGNNNLMERFTRIKEKLLRGIMSSQSLYLQDSINISNLRSNNKYNKYH